MAIAEPANAAINGNAELIRCAGRLLGIMLRRRRDLVQKRRAATA
jgi:hypothetical protein